MNILVFHITDADRTWYVWPCPSPQLYSFSSRREAERFARQLEDAHPDGKRIHMETSLEQAAALI